MLSSLIIHLFISFIFGSSFQVAHIMYVAILSLKRIPLNAEKQEKFFKEIITGWFV